MSTVRSAARVAVNENLDCYENLANAIILQAVKDYKKALRQLEGNQEIRRPGMIRCGWRNSSVLSGTVFLQNLIRSGLWPGVKENVQHEMNERRRKKAEKLRRKAELRGS